MIQKENNVYYNYAKNSLDTVADTVNRSSSAGSLDEQFKTINEYSFKWIKNAHVTYIRKDYGEVFE